MAYFSGRLVLLYMLIASFLIVFVLWTELVVWPENNYHLKVDPFDAFVLPYLTTKKKLVCPQEDVLTFVDHEKGLLLLSPKVTKNVICYFSWIHVEFSKMLIYGKETVIPMEGVQFSRENFVAKVHCFNTSSMDPDYDLDPDPIYRNTHLWIPDFPKTNATGLSVFILVLESLSRSNYMRFMPKTRAALDGLGHVQVMRGLNVVTENSFPNSLALIAGNSALDRVKPDSYDNWLPYVWEKFKAKGYVTGFTEDVPDLGIFTYNAPGFNVPPTDFVSDTFWLHTFQYYNLYQIFDSERLYCFHKNGSIVDTFLNEMKQFITKMQRKDQPYFMYTFAIQMTHEDFNNFQLVDDPVAKFVDWFKEKSLQQLNNTVFILMGDHGPRYGGICLSPLCRMESRLPLFAIRVPETLVQKYPHLPQYLASNSDRLITWFDVHQLLVDVASDDFTPITIKRENVTALSPWRELVPLNRTCEDANIPDKYCVCRNMVGEDLDYESDAREEAAVSLVKTIAAVVDPLCSIRLTYNRTLKSTYILPEGKETFASIETVKLIVLTQPWDLRIGAVMVRDGLGGSYKWTPWRIFVTKETAVTVDLKARACTAFSNQSIFNVN